MPPRLRRLRTLGVVVVIGIAIGVGVPRLVPDGAAKKPPPLPPAQVFVSAKGSDENPCTKKKPCLSFNRAYQIAEPGEIVEVAEGTYAAQELFEDTSHTSAQDVIFRPAWREEVTLERLSVGAYPNWTEEAGQVRGASHVTLRGFRVTNLVSVGNAEDVTVRSVVARSISVNGAKDVFVRAGSYGPCLAPVAFMVCTTGVLDAGIPNGEFPLGNERITFDGVTFHDYRIVQGSGEHWECLIVFNVTDLMIRNSQFRNCEQFDILFDAFSPNGLGIHGTITLEGNTFDRPWVDLPKIRRRWSSVLVSTQLQTDARFIFSANRVCPGGEIGYNDHHSVTESGTRRDRAACG